MANTAKFNSLRGLALGSFAFGVLPVRAVLYTLTDNTICLVAIQILDGIAAGIFGVVSVLIIADLTRGSGRFNITLGAISTAVGLGAALSQIVAGTIVHHFGFDAGFLFLASIAALAFAILYFLMPETRDVTGSTKTSLNDQRAQRGSQDTDPPAR